MIKYYAWLDNIYMIDDVICETDHYVITKDPVVEFKKRNR